MTDRHADLMNTREIERLLDLLAKLSEEIAGEEWSELGGEERDYIAVLRNALDDELWSQ